MKKFAVLTATMVATTAGAPGAAAYESDPPSCFYKPSGKKDVCYTDWYDGIIFVERGSTPATRRWLFASEGNTELAHARLVRPGRWNVSRAADQGFGYLGSVRRRSATRWDVYHDGRLIGYTKGPNPGVVGLFVLCRYL